MNSPREYAAGAQFYNSSLWWITGGWMGDYLNSTEMFSDFSDQFAPYSPLPKDVSHHNLVNVNNTHMVLLGGYFLSNEVFIFNR